MIEKYKIIQDQKDLLGKFEPLKQALAKKDLRKRYEEILQIVESSDHDWNNAQATGKLLKEKKKLQLQFEKIDEIQDLFEELEIGLELFDEDEATQEMILKTLESLQSQIRDLEYQQLLSDEHDFNHAIVSVSAGAGGHEACDWAQIVFRMLTRFAEKRKWKTKLIDSLNEETGGIRNATFSVKGDFAYGLLKSESGVHRLVRISPYDSNKRRHTSFCAVMVTPEIEDDIKIELKAADIRVDTYRASGAGGQHVNKTDSAVRMTHLPSGIVVQSQNERSQLQNRETCLKLLKSKLYEQEMQARRAESQKQEKEKSENAFGSQVRSYVMHPYKLVKDTRTQEQHPSPEDVLDGDLEKFVIAFLRQNLMEKS